MTKTFKVLSLLLSYPDEEWLAAAPEIEASLLAEEILPPKSLDAVIGFLRDLLLDLFQDSPHCIYRIEQFGYKYKCCFGLNVLIRWIQLRGVA